VQEGVATLEQVKRLKDDVAARMREAQDQVRSEEAQDRPEGEAEDQVPAEEAEADPQGEAQDQVRAGEAEADEPSATAVVTRVPLQDLIRLNAAALSYPEGFKVHPKLAKQLNRRREGFGPSSPLEWAHAETLAFATLLEDGVPVRLSGQDSGRGTFSQRHLVLHHGETGEMHVPLQHIGTARFEVYNSPLTEMALLGFEYGYAVAADPDLVLWEGQFGDFVNVAQVIIDQFIASGRAKWGQEARLTLLLPHGHEGQGPEHTSARLERFLQLCAEDNMRVAYPTTPAQYFHLLRRQALTPVVRPLVVMTPKSLLRHPRATSPLSELAEGSFRPVLGDASAAGRPEEIHRLVLCSGKLYYDMETHSKRESQTWVAVARIEEMHPFPAEALGDLVASFPNLQEVVWAQEEPTNMGGLFFIGPRLRAVVPRTIPLRPVARPERASPAEGRTKDHLKAQKQIVETALGIGGG
jgi:2-oxoglutarate dehydrogenase complex dehydrogenase (E1) component-like enzyme